MTELEIRGKTKQEVVLVGETPVLEVFNFYMQKVADWKVVKCWEPPETPPPPHPSDNNTDGVSDEDIESWDSTDASEHAEIKAMANDKTPVKKPDGWNKWKQQDGKRPSCDKGSHAERPKANQPNHNNFWKKKKNGG
jgi:hypothetical protein